MSKENKKIEKIEKAGRSDQEVRQAELSEKELAKVAGGSINLNSSRSNKDN